MTLQRNPDSRRTFGRAGTDAASRSGDAGSATQAFGRAGVDPLARRDGDPPSRTPDLGQTPAFGRATPDGASRSAANGARPVRDRLGDWPTVLHPELKDLLEYWRSKIGPRGELPNRAQIDPTEIPSLLTGIALYDVERTGGAYRFRYRLLGTRHTYINQYDFAGRYIEDVHYPEEAQAIYDNFSLVVDHKLPHYWHRARALRRSPNERVMYERVIVPLANEAGMVNMLFGHFVFHGAKEMWHWWRDDSTD